MRTMVGSKVVTVAAAAVGVACMVAGFLVAGESRQAAPAPVAGSSAPGAGVSASGGERRLTDAQLMFYTELVLDGGGSSELLDTIEAGQTWCDAYLRNGYAAAQAEIAARYSAGVLTSTDATLIPQVARQTLCGSSGGVE